MENIENNMKAERILIFGRGQMGGLYERFYSDKGVSVVVSSADITEAEAVGQVVSSVRPDLVINVAGKTNIDWCELNKEEAFRVNVIGAKNVALAAEAMGAFLLHYSSGCIQESTHEEDYRTELDKPNPLCHYAWTKAWAEDLVMDRVKRGKLMALIVRPRQLISAELTRSNALLKMLTYTKFIDTPNSCSVVEDLIDTTDRLVGDSVTGVVNIVNPGVTSPLKIARMLQVHIDPTMTVEEISKGQLNTMTRSERIDAVLATDKLNNLGYELRPIDERLLDIIGDLKQQLSTADGQRVLESVKADTANKLK